MVKHLLEYGMGDEEVSEIRGGATRYERCDTVENSCVVTLSFFFSLHKMTHCPVWLVNKEGN